MGKSEAARPRRSRYAVVTDLYLDDIAALRERGLSYRAIAEAVTYFRGMPLTEHQVMGALARLGEPPKQSMVRAS